MKNVVMMLLVTAFSFGFSQSVHAQNKKSVEVKATMVEKSRGANPNIKNDAPTTDVKVDKTRGACKIYFNSYCGYYIKVYVDGDYYGTLSPYAEGTVTVGSGYTTIYCISTGGTREWKAKGDCEGAYEFKLSCD